jgi:hypothetical protein
MAVPIPASLIMLPTEPNPNSVGDAPGAILVATKNMRHGLPPVDLRLVHIGGHMTNPLHVLADTVGEEVDLPHELVNGAK